MQIHEDTSDNDTDEMIIFDEDKLKKTYRKDTNVLGKRAKNVKTKKSRTAKMYTINIERKRLLEQSEKKHYRMQKIENRQRNIS